MGKRNMLATNVDDIELEIIQKAQDKLGIKSRYEFLRKATLAYAKNVLFGEIPVVEKPKTFEESLDETKTLLEKRVDELTRKEGKLFNLYKSLARSGKYNPDFSTIGNPKEDAKLKMINYNREKTVQEAINYGLAVDILEAIKNKDWDALNEMFTERQRKGMAEEIRRKWEAEKWK